MFTPPEHHHAVTESGKIYWNVRNSLGEFCRLDGTNRSTRGWTLAEWHAYMRTRYASAERATRGHMANMLGRVRGVRPSTLLHQSANGMVGRYASDELLEWITENGPTLGWRAFAVLLTTGAE